MSEEPHRLIKLPQSAQRNGPESLSGLKALLGLHPFTNGEEVALFLQALPTLAAICPSVPDLRDDVPCEAQPRLLDVPSLDRDYDRPDAHIFVGDTLRRVIAFNSDLLLQCGQQV